MHQRPLDPGGQEGGDEGEPEGSGTKGTISPQMSAGTYFSKKSSQLSSKFYKCHHSMNLQRD